MTAQLIQTFPKASILAGSESLPRALSHYSLAVALIAVALFMHGLLERFFAEHATYLLFAVPAVIIAGGFGGLGPALLTTVLGIVAGFYFSGEGYSLTLEQFVSLGAFGALGAGMGVLGDRLKEARATSAASVQELHIREAHLRSILDTIPDAMVVIDDQGSIQSFSAAAQRLFGYVQREVLSRNVDMLMRPADRRDHQRHIRDYITTAEHGMPGIGRRAIGQRKDGSTFPMELFVGETKSGGKRFFTGFVRDLTERQETEARLQELLTELSHVSRLAAMGEMASTLAHEVNQPLTVVTNYLRGARRLLESKPDEQSAILRDALNKAADHTLRVGEIVRRLREFVTRGSTERRGEDVNTLIEEASTLAFIGTANKGVQVRVEVGCSETLVLVDKVQIQQVLLNLFRNAIEAMEDSPVRELTVSCAPLDGGMVVVRVADTGPGISPEVAPQLFRAFCTTKDYGMGIGLSICRTIIEAHGGRIFVEPRPAGGTVFCFTLEAVGKDQVEERQR